MLKHNLHDCRAPESRTVNQDHRQSRWYEEGP